MTQNQKFRTWTFQSNLDLYRDDNHHHDSYDRPGSSAHLCHAYAHLDSFDRHDRDAGHHARSVFDRPGHKLGLRDSCDLL